MKETLYSMGLGMTGALGMVIGIYGIYEIIEHTDPTGVIWLFLGILTYSASRYREESHESEDHKPEEWSELDEEMYE